MNRRQFLATVVVAPIAAAVVPTQPFDWWTAKLPRPLEQPFLMSEFARYESIEPWTRPDRTITDDIQDLIAICNDDKNQHPWTIIVR